MAVPFSNTKQRLPPGFRNLLEAFAKEVIRKQPQNIVEFGAAFFEELVAERERTCLLTQLTASSVNTFRFEFRKRK